MITLVGLSGSLRKGSFNSALLRAAAAVAPKGVQLVVKTIRGIPLYPRAGTPSSGAGAD